MMSPNEVHVWYAFSDKLTEPDLLARYESLLSLDETARMRRFMLAKDRHLHLIARVLVRTTLSRYADVQPQAWTFTPNRYGRPEIAGPAQVPLRFNLSHTLGLVALAVACDREVGIDVENVERPGEYVHLAERFFARSEAAHVASLPAEQQREVFFDYWTLKESYIKARGMGLALPLADFAFQLGEPITITFTVAIADIPATWRFSRLQFGDRYKLALAVRSDSDEITITTQEMTPMK